MTILSADMLYTQVDDMWLEVADLVLYGDPLSFVITCSTTSMNDILSQAHPEAGSRRSEVIPKADHFATLVRCDRIVSCHSARR